MNIKFWLAIAGTLVIGLVAGAILFGSGQVIRLDDMERNSINADWQGRLNACDSKFDKFRDETLSREDALLESCVNSVNEYTFSAIKESCKKPITEKLTDFNKLVNDLNSVIRDFNITAKDLNYCKKK